MASTDPVALDYHATKYVLHPNSRIPVHDPDKADGPLAQDLAACAQVVGFVSTWSDIDVISLGTGKGMIDLHVTVPVRGRIYWGLRPKALAKYLTFRASMHGIAGRLIK